jgi:hypothetical protein
MVYFPRLMKRGKVEESAVVEKDDVATHLD